MRYLVLVLVLLISVAGSCKKSEDKIIDGDGNVYTSVTIGTQTWMVENLKTTRYNDGSQIRLITDDSIWKNFKSGACCWYNNSLANKDPYGALYNWYVVDSSSNGGKNVCPAGWHVPIQAEYIMLFRYLMDNGFNYDGTINDYNNVAKSLSSTSGWTESEVPGAVGNTDYPSVRNITGFSALPAGKRNPGNPDTFVDFGRGGFWWIVTDFDNAGSGVGFYMYFNLTYPNYFYTSKETGFSIRCIKD